jgi:hypothetical protein
VLVQVKASKKGGIVVIDPKGEMHPCIQPEDLWEVLNKLALKPPKGTLTPVPEALLLQVKVRRDAVILIDPLAELHNCTDPHMLWETTADLIESEDMPAMETSQAVAVRSAEVVTRRKMTREQVIREGDDVRADEVRDVIEEMVGDYAAELGTKLFSRLRTMSHRGPAPKPGSRAPQRRVKRGDIY